MTNIFEGKTVEWLLARLDVLQDAYARATGAQTSVALSPGMKDEFADLSQKELLAQLRAVRYALWCAAPGTYSNPDADRRMRVITDYSA